MIIGADNSAAVLICTDSGAKLLHYRAETFCFLQFSQASGNINISEIIDFDKKSFVDPLLSEVRHPAGNLSILNISE